MPTFVRLAALCGLLALTVPASAQEEEPPARVKIGWNGLSVRDAADNFGLELHLLLQARGTLTVSEADGLTADAALYRARPQVRFLAWQRRLVIMFQPELTGTPRVLDARLDLTPVPELTIAGGQLVVPFTRAWNTPLPLVEAPERSLNNAVFAPGRRFGAYLHGAPFDRRLEVWAGAFEPDDPSALRPELHAPMGLVRVQVNPLGELPHTELPSLAGPAPTRVGLGLAGLIAPIPDPDGGDDLLQITGTTDLGLQAKGFTLYGEGFVRWTEGGTLGWGAGATIGQFLVPRHLNLFGRVTAIDPDASDAIAARLTLEPALGGYIVGAHLLVDLRYAASLGGGEALAHAVTLHTQVMF
jgi:hypothetical protein